MRTAVAESDLIEFSRTATAIAAKVAVSIFTSSKSPSVLLHTKEMTCFLKKCESHADAYIGDTQEQCAAFVSGTKSHQATTLDRVRARKSTSKKSSVHHS